MFGFIDVDSKQLSKLRRNSIYFASKFDLFQCIVETFKSKL